MDRNWLFTLLNLQLEEAAVSFLILHSCRLHAFLPFIEPSGNRYRGDGGYRLRHPGRKAFAWDVGSRRGFENERDGDETHKYGGNERHEVVFAPLSEIDCNGPERECRHNLVAPGEIAPHDGEILGVA